MVYWIIFSPFLHAFFSLSSVSTEAAFVLSLSLPCRRWALTTPRRGRPPSRSMQ